MRKIRWDDRLRSSAVELLAIRGGHHTKNPEYIHLGDGGRTLCALRRILKSCKNCDDVSGCAGYLQCSLESCWPYLLEDTLAFPNFEMRSRERKLARGSSVCHTSAVRLIFRSSRLFSISLKPSRVHAETWAACCFYRAIAQRLNQTRDWPGRYLVEG